MTTIIEGGGSSGGGFPWTNVLILGAVAAGAYLIWSRLQAGTSTACNTLVGLPRILCELGWQVSGGTTVFDQDKICAMLGGTWNAATGLCHIGGGGSGTPTVDSHGCYVDSQHWCETEARCLDNAQHCLPPGPGAGRPGACYEWSPTFGQWLYSPNAEGCVPYYEEPLDTAQCGKYTGMCDRAYANVRSWINARSKPLLCNNAQDPNLQTWIAQFMPDDYAEVLKICNGAYDKPDTNLQQCPNGAWVDLNNPPGTTLAAACQGSEVKAGCTIAATIPCRSAANFIGANSCCGNEAACRGSGAYLPVDDYPGCFENDIQRARRLCFVNAGC